MAIYDLFSKRARRRRGEVPDVYQYDVVPQNLRVQIIHIWQDTLGERSGDVQNLYREVRKALLREYGRFQLVNDYADSEYQDLLKFFLSAGVEEVLDVVELMFRSIIEAESDYFLARWMEKTAAEAISELNHRFMEAGCGYKFEAGLVLRVDNDLLHQDVVRPALHFLTSKVLAGANQEYLSAHAHHRHQRYKECLVECLKAFESTMKAICDIKRWKYPKSASAKALIDVCLKNELLPAFSQQQLHAVRLVLESGVPTVRNNLGGHGQGSGLVEVPPHLAAFALHSTGSVIQLLASAAFPNS